MAPRTYSCKDKSYCLCWFGVCFRLVCSPTYKMGLLFIGVVKTVYARKSWLSLELANGRVFTRKVTAASKILICWHSLGWTRIADSSSPTQTIFARQFLSKLADPTSCPKGYFDLPERVDFTIKQPTASCNYESHLGRIDQHNWVMVVKLTWNLMST